MAPLSKHARKVALVGASGTIGAPILDALLAAGHKVTVVTRTESKATYPSTVTTHAGDYHDETFAANALEGQDVLIIALSFNAYDAQIPLIRAAARAGVSYIVPCEFGSDATHDRLNAEISLMAMKAPFRAAIEELGVSSWLGVVNNPWFEFSMRLGLFGIDLRGRTARVFDDGTVKASLTTLARVGESLAALLALPADELAKYKNSWVYFSSFCVSQRDIVASAMRVTGTTGKDWTITSVSSDDFIADARKSQDQMAGAMALFALTFKEGYGGDYSSKVIDYEALGPAPEDLDSVMMGLVQEIK